MAQKNINQEGKQLMTSTLKAPEVIVFEPKVSLEDGDLFDVAAAGLQFEGRINRVSTDLLIDLDVMRYNATVRNDVINVPNLLDVLEQAHQIINRSIYNTMTLQPSYSGTIRRPNGKQIVISIIENETNNYSIAY